MAQNIFDVTFDANNRIDVNSFDWSHVNNLTTDFGRITPVFCELVPAKGSLRINPEFGLELMPMVFPVQTRMFARLNFFKVTLRSMWEDYSDFISNFRDDLEEPYILPNIDRFTKMCTTGSLGDYLGLPTFGTSYSDAVSLADNPCATNSRGFSETSLSEAIEFVRADQSISGVTCGKAFNYNNKGVVFFRTASSSVKIPDSVSQVGINISIVGGSADVFVGCSGFLIHFSDDGTYEMDIPVTIIRSKDNVVSVQVSSVDKNALGGIQGSFMLLLSGMTTAAPIEFTGQDCDRYEQFNI